MEACPSYIGLSLGTGTICDFPFICEEGLSISMTFLNTSVNEYRGLAMCEEFLAQRLSLTKHYKQGYNACI